MVDKVPGKVCIRVAAVSSRTALPTPDTSNSRGGESVMKGKTYLSTHR